MPQLTANDFLSSGLFLTILKGGIIILLIFYAIFALLIVRQVDLMIKTLITPISPKLKALAIIHAGAAIGVVVLAWGIL